MISKAGAWFAAQAGLAVEGLPNALAIALAGVVLWAIGLWWLGIPILIASVLVGAFFRDPERSSGAPARSVLSGADGKVCGVAEVPLPGASAPLYRRVSVFMSPLDVHVNRAPISGEVLRIEHTAGVFGAAFHDLASERNERNLIELSDERGRHHAMVQIAGYLARRIVCRVNTAQRIERGQRIGLIMFGSRVDHYFPLDYRVTVQQGERVRAGETVIGEPANG
jgi:phosphatidylserine decarboxylase